MARLRLLLIVCYVTVVIARGGGRGGGRGRSGYYSRSSGRHTYPSHNGLSGNSASSGRRHQPSQSHTYPENSGLSGNNHKSPSQTHKNEVHNHYHYHPPQHISYGSQQHPVYVGSPPSYVYVYKNSGSRFDNLLTGLALYNLGRASNSGYQSHHREYTSKPGEEICKLVISKSNGEYEETKIDCKLMSSFIWDAERENKPNVFNVTSKVTSNVTQIVNGNVNSTVTFQNTTVVEALHDKGTSIKVNPGMKCFIVRLARNSSMLKRKVECGLLQEYATRSLRYQPYSSRCTRLVPGLSLMVSLLLILRG